MAKKSLDDTTRGPLTLPRTYRVTLTGATPLIMHANDLDWRAQMDTWLLNPTNKKSSKAGDDRTPAYRWLGACYHDGHVLGVPSDNLMTMLREGGTKVPKSGNKTWKTETQTGLVVNEILWPFVPAVPWAPLSELITELDFRRHVDVARDLGIDLFAKPCKVGTSSHVRVRPRFNTWTIAGTITVLDDTLTRAILQMILDEAGVRCGLGDWRPSAPKKPGPWGKFVATVED